MKLLAVDIASGYHLAVLAKLCRRVYALASTRDSLIEVERAFEVLRLRNTTTRVGAVARGWPEAAPFERILVGDPGEAPPPALLAQLGQGGIMLMPLGPIDGAQVLCRLRRTADGVIRDPIPWLRFASPLTGPAAEAGDAGAG
jgi:protein-L-isoaspartate(D-aspartate) O-methyltransferase